MVEWTSARVHYFDVFRVHEQWTRSHGRLDKTTPFKRHSSELGHRSMDLSTDELNSSSLSVNTSLLERQINQIRSEIAIVVCAVQLFRFCSNDLKYTTSGSEVKPRSVHYHHPSPSNRDVLNWSFRFWLIDWHQLSSFSYRVTHAHQQKNKPQENQSAKSIFLTVIRQK